MWLGRPLLALLLIGLSFGGLRVGRAAQGDRAAGGAHEAPPWQGALAAANDLHILGVDRDDDRKLRWLVWSESSPTTKTVNLTLIADTAQGPRTVFHTERKDAYDVEVRRLHAWRYGQHPILAFSYREGAAAEQIELYGLEADGMPVKLDEQSGEDLEWSAGRNGELLLVSYDKPEGRLVPSYYRWDDKKHKLASDPGPGGRARHDAPATKSSTKSR
jgi:hypothetical protein